MRKSDKNQIRSLILGMREVYARGENAMAWTRKKITLEQNLLDI